MNGPAGSSSRRTKKIQKNESGRASWTRNAETDFRILETRGKFSLIEAKPVTGRTHQIRVHLAESGLPIVGDELYGKREDDFPSACARCGWRISIRSPKGAWKSARPRKVFERVWFYSLMVAVPRTGPFALIF